MDIPWDDLRLFLAVAEHGSLSGAARRLRMGQPTVSRRLAELEDTLGYALFRRSVDGAALTAAGERWLAPARQMAEWAGELGRLAEHGEARAGGLVRLAAPPGVAFDVVAPFAAWVRQRYPQIRLEVLSSIEYLDLTRGEADLALRFRAPTQRDLVSVATLEHPVAAFASRDYVKTLPKRYGMADVRWICWAPPYHQVAPNPQLEQLIPDFVPSFTSDNFLVQQSAAEAGLGAMILGNVPHRFRRPSELVPLQLELGPYGRASMYLVAAKSALDIPRVRAVAELLTDELARAQKKIGGAARA